MSMTKRWLEKLAEEHADIVGRCEESLALMQAVANNTRATDELRAEVQHNASWTSAKISVLLGMIKALEAKGDSDE